MTWTDWGHFMKRFKRITSQQNKVTGHCHSQTVLFKHGFFPMLWVTCTSMIQEWFGNPKLNSCRLQNKARHVRPSSIDINLVILNPFFVNHNPSNCFKPRIVTIPLSKTLLKVTVPSSFKRVWNPSRGPIQTLQHWKRFERPEANIIIYHIISYHIFESYHITSNHIISLGHLLS